MSSPSRPTIRVVTAEDPEASEAVRKDDKTSRRNSAGEQQKRSKEHGHHGRRSSCVPPTSKSGSPRKNDDHHREHRGRHHHHHSPQTSPSGSGTKQETHLSLSKYQSSNVHMRRKSSPAITAGLDSLSLHHLQSQFEQNHGASSTSRKQPKSPTRRVKNEQLFVQPNASQIANRRLSSPPETFFEFNFGKSMNSTDCDQGSDSSNGSLSKLSIAGLNPSSSDLRANTVISGHQSIGTLFGTNDMTQPESISINILNAPGNSTMQCDCGHINCPLCNLMMNLELTDPSQLM